ncbi:MAG: 16S rRNA (cytidine(1402)-2'-O)-methyltransferase [Thermaerobacter sp.]|nr:16S rRNA (cytidine(1402)-2'-O)-methyltransferase [Thermaerobacter sp.]
MEPGTLYLVATPIGNLADWSPRARQVLAQVDGVLAEDTRVAGLLCHNAGIDVQLTSFHAHNTRRRIPEVLRRLEEGQTLALVSDRGMPAVSDPGQELVEAIWAHGGLQISVVPGPSAAIAAFAASGFPAPFAFWGFLPRMGAERRAAILAVAAWPYAAVLYEAPHHMAKTLQDLVSVVGDREIFLAREMTKRYEELWRGPIRQLVQSQRTWRGECVLVLGPAKKIPGSAPIDWDQLASRVEQLVSTGLHPNDAIRQVARESGVPRRDLYQQMHSR